MLSPGWKVGELDQNAGGFETNFLTIDLTLLL